MANCGCNNNNNDEKVLSESGLRHIIEKLTGKMLLAVGTIKARGEGPLHLWRKYTPYGVVVHGKVDEATQEGPGVMSAEDKARLDKLWEMYGEREVTVTYEKPEITKFDYDDIPAEGGTVTPTIEFTQACADSDGNNWTLTQDDTDYDVEFTPQETFNGASINTTTGAVTKSTENGITERAQAAILYAKVKANGMESDTRWHTVYQAAAELKYTYGSPSITIRYPDLPNEVGAEVSPEVLVTQSVTTNDGSNPKTLYLSAAECDEVEYNSNDSGGLTNATLDENTGAITCTALNETTERLILGVVNINVKVNGMTGSGKVSPYQEANNGFVYGDIAITKFDYNNIPAEGGSVMPQVAFTQTRTDQNGETVTLTEETTDYEAVFGIMGTELEKAYIDTETGEVSTDRANTDTETRSVCTATMIIIANGKTSGTAHQTVHQDGGADPWTGVTKPVVTMDEAIYVEESGSGTKKIYFNVNVTMNDASIVSPDYFESGGVKYYVTQETATNRNDSGQEVTTAYSVEVPYNGSGAFTSSPLYSAFEVHTDGGDLEGEVESTNNLVNADGTFSVRI